MADLSGFKRSGAKSRLGTPPPPSEASSNLAAPEIAPAIEEERGRGGGPIPRRRDGRSLRRTNRTLQLATRITPETDGRIRAICDRDNLKIAELIEKSIEAYDQQR